MSNSREVIAFDGDVQIAAGPLSLVAGDIRQAVDRGGPRPVLAFDRLTSELIDLDPASLAPREVADPAAAVIAGRRTAGRPKLGVVAREVTLLPRHWEWLAAQPGGASVTLRRLVEQARRANVGADRVRQAREAAYKFMTAMAGNRPGYEEALRALFAGDRAGFDERIAAWPPDIEAHVRALATPAFET